MDGASEIKLWGETVRVAATIHTIGGLSAHADQTALTNWYKQFEHSPPLVLVHGEEEAQECLQDRIQAETNANVSIAKYGQKLDLNAC